jgi:uncharacterized membrane protein YhaH (DUF805 family)
MTFAGAITTCLRKYAVFSGRATRAEFWWWVLAVFIVSIALGMVDAVIEVLSGWDGFSLLSGIFSLAVLLPNLAVTVRRLHDIGKTGWWVLVWIVLGVGPWLILAGLVIAAVWGTFVAAGTAPDPAEFFIELLTGFALIWILAISGLIFAILVSLAIVIWQIVWLARPGETGPNRYRPDPRAI